MSIQSEIARLSKNISDSLDAVAAKGVTVPSGSNSDDLATLIAQINEIEDGNNLSYGYTDGTLPMVGVGKVGSAEI